MLRLLFWNAVLDVLTWLSPRIERAYCAAYERRNHAAQRVLP